MYHYLLGVTFCHPIFPQAGSCYRRSNVPWLIVLFEDYHLYELALVHKTARPCRILFYSSPFCHRRSMSQSRNDFVNATM